MRPKTDPLAFLSGSAVDAARRLLGCIIEREVDGVKLVARIVETEAYDMDDAASHSYNGETGRTKVMFGPAGYLYVYFTYGMHYCCNIVTGPVGHGSAVLIRAVEPIEGAEDMALRRKGRDGKELTNGPAKLCQALVIGKAQNGQDLREPPLQLIVKPTVPANQIAQTTRIGISQSKGTPWRFYIRGNQYVSRP